ncbi:class IV adenylate cyclase [Candidatus Woesearchaeota archaeon]|nr:class IV adenylate cyclase [Candidatus Woesearchaeota archaeon]
MNQEIEIKAKIINMDQARAVLEEKAEFVEEIYQKDEYFTPEQRDYFAEVPTKEYLRVRHQEGRSSIAYHFCHFREDNILEQSDEYETEVEDANILSSIFRRVGMVHKVTVTKRRRVYMHDDAEIVLDDVEELGHFIEVESKLQGDAKLERDRCIEILNRLGIDHTLATTMGYPDMLMIQREP